jgi:tetratricopeptide (TPR) repeat protein
MELARALWLHGDSPLGALRTAVGSLSAAARHLEASLWLGGSVLFILAAGLVLGGLVCIAVTSVFSVTYAAHDLGDVVPGSMPAFARMAFLASLVLLLPALGEGILGLALALLALGLCYARKSQKTVIAAAGLAVLLGAYPVARLAGATLGALHGDPVAEAAYSASHGVAVPVDVARLEAAPEDDLLAAQARARLARRVGNLGQADAMYQAILRETPDDPVVLNNAANVRLHLGHMESALELYGRALEVEESPTVLFNLSQAYGRAFEVEEVTRALGRAQQLDSELVTELTRLQGAEPEGFVVDLPLPTGVVLARVFDAKGGSRFAAALRSHLAPGLLGSSPGLAFGVWAAVVAGALLMSRNLRPSRSCRRCGRLVCPRCHSQFGAGELCEPCNRLFYQPEHTDRELRLARVEALREREARLDKLAWLASLVVPGVAGLLANRALRSLLGSFFFALALSAVVWRHGVVPDPLVAGAMAPFALLGLAASASIGYAIVVATSLAARWRS